MRVEECGEDVLTVWYEGLAEAGKPKDDGTALGPDQELISGS